MGCDIHLHTEVKINGKWEHWGNPYVPRNYTLFALMADVRNNNGEIRPVSKPKGLPSDISVVTKFDADRWEGDGHSHSWLSSSEIAKLEDDWAELTSTQDRWANRLDLEHHMFGYLCGNSWAGFHKYPQDRRPGIEDVRFVFWFDN